MATVQADRGHDPCSTLGFLGRMRHRVMFAADLHEGDLQAVLVGGRSVLLTRISGQVRAADNLCPHAGSPLVSGKLLGRTIRCPLHGFRFDLETGEALGPVACSSLSIHVAAEIEGEIIVELNDDVAE